MKNSSRIRMRAKDDIMKRIIIGITLIAAAFQVHAAFRQGDGILGRACRDVHGVEMSLVVMGEKWAISCSADTGSFRVGADPRQWMAHKGETDENGCHKDKYGRRHCHKKQKQ
uniref:Uncharacterized protein n=1 Tax=Candidatus Kentrum sp. TC TaxID=2126339 RepID=A0A450YSA2_9GAMM|nr:MAG: hypothetical protein BECKTC1821E_GA0114239_103511 [Candidatus Kentron sp. TC]